MGKLIVWIVLGIVAVIVALWVFNYVKEEAQPLTFDPAAVDRIATGQLGANDLVLVSLDDGVIHRPRCPEIQGTTQKMILRAADEQEYQTCEFCIDIIE